MRKNIICWQTQPNRRQEQASDVENVIGPDLTLVLPRLAISR